MTDTSYCRCGCTKEQHESGACLHMCIPGIGVDKTIGMIQSLADNPELLEIARKAVEDELVDFRESRISMMGRGNGLVICESDGTPSSHIRLGTEHALKIGLKAIIEHLETK